MKNLLLVMLISGMFVYACASKQKAEDSEYMDEGAGEIQEDKVTEDTTPVVKDGSLPLEKSVPADRSKVLIKKYFDNDTTYVIICRGFPKEGSEQAEAKGTSKEAALINAQMIAKQTFTETVDVIKNGSIEKYTEYEGFAVIYYIVKFPRLKKYLREENPFVD